MRIARAVSLPRDWSRARSATTVLCSPSIWTRRGTNVLLERHSRYGAGQVIGPALDPHGWLARYASQPIKRRTGRDRASMKAWTPSLQDEALPRPIDYGRL